MSIKAVEETVDAENTFTEAISPTFNRTSSPDGKLNVSVGADVGWVAIITLQRSFDAGVTWNDVTTFSSPEEATLEEFEEGVIYRIGCKTGDYTSGDVPLRLSR